MFIELMTGVTFLFPSKKVTKEIVIGEALTAGKLPHQSRLGEV